MSFPRYSSYHDSGVEWLGEVPSHWPVVRFKTILRERDERSETGDEELLSVSAYTGVSPRSQIIDDGDYLSRAESLIGYKRCFPNDLVMNIMLAWNRGLGVSQHAGIVSPAYCVFALSSHVDPRFLNYLSRSNEYIGYFKAFSTGVIDSRLRIYPDTFGALYCGLPPLAEQAIIAAFLDRETGKIDALVEEQKRLIDLLKEKRQAVISHAVTKGLNPDAPMKDSGVEWLGEVPAHWEVGALRRFVDAVYTGRTPKTESPSEEVDEGVPWFTPGDFDGELRLKSATKFVPKDAVDSGDASHFPAGSVLVVSIGATLGKIGLASTPSSANQQINAVIPSKRLNSEFLAYSLSAKQGVMRYLSNASTIGIMNQDKTKEIPLALPPVTEQIETVMYLDGLLGNLDLLTTEAESTITLLQERRVALISAAVTGKIDVRGLVTDDAQPLAAPIRETVDA